MRASAKASSAGMSMGSGRGLSFRALKGILILFGLLTALAVLGASSAAAAPVISAQPASEVKITSAVLKGSVNPEEVETFCLFNYITDAQFTENEANSLPGFEGATEIGCSEAFNGNTSQPIAPVTLAGLTAGTTYHLRFVAFNQNGEGATDVAPNFTTLPAPHAPAVTLEAPSAVGFTSAHLAGTINPEGGNIEPGGVPVPLSWEFQVALASEPGNWQFAGTGPFIEGLEAESSGPIAVSADPGLANGSEYKARLRVVYAGKEALSTEKSFTTQTVSKPAVTINDASSIAGTTAHFSGEVTPGNLDAAFNSSCAFDYVPDAQFQLDGFGSAQAIGCEPPEPIDGATAVHVTADVTGLEPHTVYHLRLRAENQGGQGTAEAATFQTEAIAPLIESTSVSEVTTTSATLRAEVNPGGASTTYHFEYLTLAEYEEAGGSFAGATLTPESAPIGEDFTFHAVEAAISGLSPDTPYRLRAVATNAKSGAGGKAGPVIALRTFEAPSGIGDSCPNAALRAQQHSGFLPECRAYELVNKPGLDLGDVFRVYWASNDGEYVAYLTNLPDDEALGGGVAAYTVAHRTPTGWIWKSADLTALGPISGTGETILKTVSEDGSRAVLTTTMPITPDDTNEQTDIYGLQVGTGVGPMLSSPALAVQTVINSTPSLGNVLFLNLLGAARLYLSNEAGEDTLIGAYPPGPIPCGGCLQGGAGPGFLWGLGTRPGEFGGASPFVPHGGMRGISDDGKVVYWTTNDGTTLTEEEEEAGTQLRENTDLIVRDLRTDPPRSLYVGASERTGEVGKTRPVQFLSGSADGLHAYLASTSRLTDNSPKRGGIYRFSLDAPAGERLERLTPPVGKLSNAVVSADESHIYFVSENALAPAAVQGERNAYVWSEGDGIRFIGKLGPSGEIARVTIDGRFAMLISAESIDGAANNGMQAVYEYDDTTGNTACASCRPDGSPSQGAADVGAQTKNIPNAPALMNRGIAGDGALLFVSEDRILPADQNNVKDVYLFHNGKVSLISSGTGTTDSYPGDISDNGTNVTFITRSALLPVDQDGEELDVYDARVGGGFAEPPPPTVCEGSEACRGEASKAGAAPAVVTKSLEGGKVQPAPRKCGKGKVRRHAKCVKKSHQKKGHGKKTHAKSRKSHKGKGGGR